MPPTNEWRSVTGREFTGAIVLRRSTSVIAISAASGALGRLVIQAVRARAEVVAVVRDPGRAPEGVPVRRGDYDDPASLREAFQGADRLLLISSPELDTARRIRQHLNAVTAAKEAGVGAIVFTSFLGGRHRSHRPDRGLSHHRTGHPRQRPAVHAAASPLLQRRVRPAGLQWRDHQQHRRPRPEHGLQVGPGRGSGERTDGRGARRPRVRLHRAPVELSRGRRGPERHLPRGARLRPHELDLRPGAHGRPGTPDPRSGTRTRKARRNDPFSRSDHRWTLITGSGILIFLMSAIGWRRLWAWECSKVCF
ncbi:NAD(P)H-binding protein [Nonomuraea salmonea]|uniref:NAD(P)H-binding protein n=1 Tax=Nonomuraea salmonea TaxID=46181 RepID=UPI003CD0955E